MAQDARSMASKCPLEDLPNDVSVALLSASTSFRDLHAIVRASPTLYRCFVLFKRSILISILLNDLGLVIRDAVALSITPQVGWDSIHDYEGASQAIERYQSLPAGPKSTKGLTIENVISIIRFQYVVDFFIREYTSWRFPVLRRAHPDAAVSLSNVERQRLAQAFIRYQLLIRIHPELSHKETDNRVLQAFLGKFSAWEIQQLVCAHIFAYKLCNAMAGFKPVALDPHVPDYRRRETMFYESHTQDLVLLREKFESVYAALVDNPEELESSRRQLARPDSCHSKISFLESSHRWTQDQGGFGYSHPTFRYAIWEGETSDDCHRRELEMPPIVYGTTITDPPFGWVNALDGLNCFRWGVELYKQFPYSRGTGISYSDNNGWPERRKKVARWWWMGFLFWDKDRVDLLKSAIPDYGTGWLPLIWDYSVTLSDDLGVAFDWVLRRPNCT